MCDLDESRWVQLMQAGDPYWISWKSNGDRYDLLITTLRLSVQRVSVMINRRLDCFLVELPCPLEFYGGTLLAGDLIHAKESIPQASIPPPFRRQGVFLPSLFEINDVQVCSKALVGSLYTKSARQDRVYRLVDTWNAYLRNPEMQGVLTAVPFGLSAKPWVPLERLPEFVGYCRLGYLGGAWAKPQGTPTGGATDR